MGGKCDATILESTTCRFGGLTSIESVFFAALLLFLGPAPLLLGCHGSGGCCSQLCSLVHLVLSVEEGEGRGEERWEEGSRGGRG